VALADRSVGGAVNIVQRDAATALGGMTYSFTSPDLIASNLSDELEARGLKQSASLKKHYDLAGAFGGPIMRDRLWFFASTRRGTTHLYQQGNYYNKLQDTTPWLYEPDLPSGIQLAILTGLHRPIDGPRPGNRFSRPHFSQPNCNRPSALTQRRRRRRGHGRASLQAADHFGNAGRTP
jgi:hypothetical protein